MQLLFTLTFVLHRTANSFPPAYVISLYEQWPYSVSISTTILLTIETHITARNCINAKKNES
jgi:hypothetical protein